ncbi:MAG: IS1634 family transposase, partial [Thermoplasmata archaeon]
SPSALNRLIDKIGLSSLYRDFSKELINNITPKESILYDITSIPSYSTLPIFEYGHAKDHQELPQINLAMVMEKNRRIPLGFEIYPGSIPDMVTLERFVNNIFSKSGSMFLILDRGFFNHENLKRLSNFDYIMAASLVRKEVKKVYAQASRTVQRAENVVIYGKKAIFCKGVSFRMDEIDLRGYFYYDPVREGEEKEEFHRVLSEKREQIEKLEVMKGVMERAKEIAGTYSKYLQISVKDNKVITKPRNKAISAIENRMGKFLLVYHGNYTGLECLMYYMERDNIEKAFEMLKSDLEIFPLRGKKEETIRGIIFVQFIALIMRMAMLKKMEE